MVVAVHVPRLSLLVALLGAGRPLERPVALAPPAGSPQVVGLCTPAAEAMGVRLGLRVGEALARCPHLDLVEPDPEGAADAGERVLARLEAMGAAVEPVALGVACFESSGLERLHGGLSGVLCRVRAALPVGAGGRVGAAPSRFAALQAAREARTGAALVIRAGEVAGFLAPLPVARLPLAPELVRALDELGLWTIGQVAALPRAATLERLGFAGLAAWRLAGGGADQAPRPRRPPEPLSAELELPEAIGALPALETAARLVLAELAARARARRRALRALTLRVRLADGGSWTRELTLREASGDPERLAAIALPRLAEVTGPVIALAVSGDAGAPLGGRQLTAIESGKDERRRRASEATRQVRAAAGPEAVLRAVELEPWSLVPERAWTLVAYENGESFLGPAKQDVSGLRSRTLSGLRSRTPWPAEVIASPAGVPHALLENGRRRAVIAVREDWLVQDRWWTHQPVDRHYFEIVLEPGRVALVYRELRSGRWLAYR